MNVIYTLVGEDFQNWVDERIDARNQKVAEDDNKVIEVDPEVAAAFNASNYISGKLVQQTVRCRGTDSLIFLFLV